MVAKCLTVILILSCAYAQSKGICLEDEGFKDLGYIHQTHVASFQRPYLYGDIIRFRELRKRMGTEESIYNYCDSAIFQKTGEYAWDTTISFFPRDVGYIRCVRDKRAIIKAVVDFVENVAVEDGHLEERPDRSVGWIPTLRDGIDALDSAKYWAPKIHKSCISWEEDTDNPIALSQVNVRAEVDNFEGRDRLLYFFSGDKNDLQVRINRYSEGNRLQYSTVFSSGKQYVYVLASNLIYAHLVRIEFDVDLGVELEDENDTDDSVHTEDILESADITTIDITESGTQTESGTETNPN